MPKEEEKKEEKKKKRIVKWRNSTVVRCLTTCHLSMKTRRCILPQHPLPQARLSSPLSAIMCLLIPQEAGLESDFECLQKTKQK